MKNTELSTFENPIFGCIRGFLDDKGEPWFLAGQVCRCLGIKNTSQAVEQIKQRMNIAGQFSGQEKDIFSKYTLLKPKTVKIETSGGVQTSIIIPENYLYELIFTSKKQKAIVFRAWVTTEVLPSLRKHGEYRMQGKLIRRSLTDSLKESGENERMHGFGYSTYSMMINKSLGLPNKVNRDELSSEMLEKIAVRENLVQSMVAEGKTYGEIKIVIENNFLGVVA